MPSPQIVAATRPTSLPAFFTTTTVHFASSLHHAAADTSPYNMDLPGINLTTAASRHADCCLSFSATLFDTLISIVEATEPSGPSILSVGSGSGLLEAALLSYCQSRSPKSAPVEIQGVEVYQSARRAPVNKYLPEQFYHTVRGTWDLSPRRDVSALMFVYPRQPSLVSQYTGAMADPNSHINIAVWLGPVADWDEFSACLKAPHLSVAEVRHGAEAGLDDYEMLAYVRRITP